MSEPTYGAIGGEGDLPALARLVSHAFAGPLDASTEWLRSAGPENVRLLREGGTPVASLVRVPMGQYFGRRSVPMTGVAAVAVAPEARGRGLARRLMREALREMAGEGCPISCLYASTQTLYRQVGYEQAGYRCMVRVPLAHIDVRERGAPVTSLGEDDRSAVEACYAVFASAHNGWLDRGPYCWARVREARGERFHGFGVAGAGRLDGYVFLTQRRKPETGRHDVVVSDVAFRTAEAGRRLLGFLADFATVGDDLVFFGGPRHALLWLLGQQRFTLTHRDYWMIRVTDAARAIESRGYPGAVRADLLLDLTDDLLGGNRGTWALTVADSRARLEPRRDASGTPDVRLDVRALAALWSGFAKAPELRLLGALEGDDAAILALDGVFGGGAPAMPDMF